MIEIFIKPEQAESDHRPAVIHIGNPFTKVAWCGFQASMVLPRKTFRTNCAKCLAIRAMRTDLEATRG